MFFVLRLLLIFIMLGLAAAFVAVVVPALRSYLGGDERRLRGPRALPAPADQMERLEERLEQLALEQQQFITKLLQERADRPRDDAT